jgi:hypothetical protein
MPEVLGMVAGYSGTPLPKKLGIKDGSVVVLLGAPEDFGDTLGVLPSGVRIRREAVGKADVVLLFVASQADLAERFSTAAEILAEGGRLWILWPKKASRVTTDVGEREVRTFGLARGFVDYKISAIDVTWSGLCFARRRPDSR